VQDIVGIQGLQVCAPICAKCMDIKCEMSLLNPIYMNCARKLKRKSRLFKTFLNLDVKISTKIFLKIIYYCMKKIK
jgi:hypothetical protein